MARKQQLRKPSVESLADKLTLLYGKTNSKLAHGCVKNYFLKNGRVSVVLIMSKGGKKILARGVSGCDFADSINKAYGIGLAKTRAFRKLLGREKTDMPVMSTVSKKIFSGTGIDKKAELNPKLTDTEKAILQYL